MKKRIIFVDDESRVLAGLRRMLYHMRNEWDMAFVGSGEEALATIATDGPFDVIVSDMRMPDIDGATLLSEVKERYPDMIRFILSGYSDRDMILRTVGSTDQFLTKPCDPVILKDTINKAFEAQQLVEKGKARKMVAGMKNLPTLPDLYVKLKEILDSPKSSFKQIADIVSNDVTVTAKVLQLVNSAFFGLRHRIENIQHAVTYLGIETLKAVVLTADVFSQFSPKEIEDFNIRELYRHSIFVGMLGKKIASTVSSDKLFIDEVGMIGILHDIGKVIFIRNKPDEYRAILEKQMASKQPLYVLEEKHLGVSHAELGGYLMSLWGLPDTIVNSIVSHHDPKRVSKTTFTAATAICIANVLDHEVVPEEHSDESEVLQENAEQDKALLAHLSLDEEYLKHLNIWNHIGAWRNECMSTKISQSGGEDLF